MSSANSSEDILTCYQLSYRYRYRTVLLVAIYADTLSSIVAFSMEGRCGEISPGESTLGCARCTNDRNHPSAGCQSCSFLTFLSAEYFDVTRLIFGERAKLGSAGGTKNHSRPGG